jgi:hypothetical protein
MNSVRHAITIAAMTGAVAAGVSCGDVVRQGNSPVMLVVDSMQASSTTSTGSSGTPSSVLNSDVETKGSVFNDPGTAMLRIVPKNINTTPTGPLMTTNNEVRITRIHIAYRRTDGQNQPGVDVPYPVDTASTITLPATGLAVPIGFDLVRHDAKLESPLYDLRSKLVVINTIAEVTFYGVDATGNELNTTSYITVNFADFGDPS